MAEMNEAHDCVRRGIYQKRVQTAEESFEDILSNRVLEILSNTRAQLTNCNISVFDILRMSERDKKVVKQIGKIAEDIDQLTKRPNQYGMIYGMVIGKDWRGVECSRRPFLI